MWSRTSFKGIQSVSLYLWPWVIFNLSGSNISQAHLMKRQSSYPLNYNVPKCRHTLRILQQVLCIKYHNFDFDASDRYPSWEYICQHMHGGFIFYAKNSGRFIA